MKKVSTRLSLPFKKSHPGKVTLMPVSSTKNSPRDKRVLHNAPPAKPVARESFTKRYNPKSTINYKAP